MSAARAPGLSVRLKLTLSYAGFLMLAGALLLAVVWVFLLRYVPEVVGIRGPFGPSRSDLERAFVPKAAIALAFLLVFGLAGGWILAGSMLAPLNRITHATRLAAEGSLAHRIHMEGRNDEFRELADAFDAMLERLEAHVAEQQRFAANASHELRTPLAITQTLLEVARNDPHRDSSELIERLRFVNARAIELTEALLVLSRADQRSFARGPVDLSLLAEEATETLLPLAEERGVAVETSGEITLTSGSHALLLQMTTNLLHNAIVHNVPEHGTVHVSTATRPRVRRAHGREHRRHADATGGLDVHRTVPAGHRTHPRRPCRRRPRPGHRQQHHPSTRRNAHHRSPPRRWAPRHGPAARRTRAAGWLTDAWAPAASRSATGCSPATSDPLTSTTSPGPSGPRAADRIVHGCWAVEVHSHRHHLDPEPGGVGRDQPMAGGRIVDLGHQAEHRHPPAGGHRGEGVEGGHHGGRVGVVGVVHDQRAARRGQDLHPAAPSPWRWRARRRRRPA